MVLQKDIHIKKWVSRPYSLGDEEGISLLFKETFPHDFKNYGSYWQWEFANNPAGKYSIQLAEDKNGIIVGQYAITHRKMWINSSVINVALSLDTMTHPDFRKQGIFTCLANDLYKRLGDNQIHLTYGFPNINSVIGFEKKLDWYIFGSTPVMIRPINLKQIFALSGCYNESVWIKYLTRIFSMKWNFPIHKIMIGCRWSRLSRFDSEVDTLWQQIRCEHTIAIDRNSQYLNWRYVEKPGDNYLRLALRSKSDRLLGIMILKIVEYNGVKLGVVADIIALPGQLLRTAMINYAVTTLKKLGADAVISVCIPNTGYFKPFQMNSFFKIPDALNPVKNYWGVRRNSRYLSPNIIFDPKQWLISCGDTDLI